MHLSHIILAAATALAVSLPSPYNTPNTTNTRSLESFSGENGFYSVVTGRDGTHMATFTPFEKINAVIEERDTSLVARDANTSPVLSKRLDWIIQCQGQVLPASEVLAAQATLRASLGDFGTIFTAEHWGFVKYDVVIVYFCIYGSHSGGFLLTPSMVNDYEVELDFGCGWPNAGWDYRYASSFLSVGRRAYGGEICTSGFKGW